jgi:predicted branched-subunit amino acid permease
MACGRATARGKLLSESFHQIGNPVVARIADANSGCALPAEPHAMTAPPTHAPDSGQHAALTWGGIRQGIRLMLPFYIPITIFGSAVGAVAANKGLTLAELTVMNVFVYAGMAQLVALGLWQESWTGTALISIGLTTLAINARLLLMSASFRPWFSSSTGLVAYPSLLTLTDANYVVGQRYYLDGGRDIGVFLGAGLVLWIVWVLAPIPGYLLGNLIHNPRDVGMDLIMPVIFSAMVARLWRGRNDTLSILVAALVGLGVNKAFGGSLHVVAGALAGMITAAALVRPATGGGER